MKKVLLTILALTLTTSAFWPAGGVKVVETPDVIEDPQMVYINDGSVVISWEADRLIYCQKLDTTGVIHWDAGGVRVCLSDSAQRDHHMVTDGQDVWFVWQDERADDGDIYAQKISGSTGQRLWGDQGKEVCVKEGEQRRQKCTVLSEGDFIASWTDAGIDPYNVGSQRLNSDGQSLWADNGIYVGRDFAEAGISTVLPSGSAGLDVWVGIKQGEADYGYFAQRIDSEGNFLWDTLGVLIEYAVGFHGVVSDNAGGGIVLFDTGEGYAVQRIDSLGQVLWTPGGVTIMEPTALLKTGPKSTLLPQEPTKGLISDNQGGCFVWWQFNGLHTQHVDSSGGIMWGLNGVTYWTKKEEEDPLASTTLCSDGNNGVMAVFDNVAWGGMENPYSVELGVWVQRIDTDGQKLFDTDGVITKKWNPDSLPWDKFMLTGIAIPGGVIACWGDNRHDPNWSLYAQIVDTTGKVGSGIEEEPLPVIDYPNMEVNQNIAFGSLSLRYSIPPGESGVIKLFDTSGRLIRTQTLQQEEGVINWNTKDFPSGVYFVQLETTKNKSISQKMLILH